VVPESVMPNYPWLQDAKLDPAEIQSHMRGMLAMGIPYAEADIEAAPGLVSGKTEEDAVIAYLQVLGTMAQLDDTKVYRE
jgi:cytochrome c oxidase cbb3-type subunit 2